jgi:hypothetical protein
MVETRKTCAILVGKRRWKMSRGRFKREVNIEASLQETGRQNLNPVHLFNGGLNESR